MAIWVMLSPRNALWVVWIICFPYVIFRSEASTTFLFYSCSFRSSCSPDSVYASNLNGLLSNLAGNATRDNNGFYNTSEGNSAPDVAYGLFLCRGDVTTDVCRQCVIRASNEIINQCPGAIKALIWYDECMLRYANRSFVSTMDESRLLRSCDVQPNVTDQTRFNQLVGDMMMNLSNRASNEASNFTVRRGFESGQVFFNSTRTIYGSVQCTPDISGWDCNRCLTTAIGYWNDSSCSGSTEASVLFPSCNIRYALSGNFVPETPLPEISGLPPSNSSTDPRDGLKQERRQHLPTAAKI